MELGGANRRMKETDQTSELTVEYSNCVFSQKSDNFTLQNTTWN